MSYTGDEISGTYVELLSLNVLHERVRIEGAALHETLDPVDSSAIINLLRIAGVDARALREGARFHLKISYSYPS